ncbi:MAG: hypothetical protein MUE84_19970 [Hyphomonas sp.]|nr:hypothetical protein [Hyphomonas sp.]
MKSITAAILGAVLALTVPAQAGEAHSHAAKHGGKVVDSGHHHMEIVATDGVLEIHLAHDDGTPENVANAKAKATVLSEGQKHEIALTPEPANVLKGTGSFKAVKGTVIVVTLTMPGHEPEQARLKLD